MRTRWQRGCNKALRYASEKHNPESTPGRARGQGSYDASRRICSRRGGAYPPRKTRRPLHQAGHCYWSFKGPSRGGALAAAETRTNFGAYPQAGRARLCERPERPGPEEAGGETVARHSRSAKAGTAHGCITAGAGKTSTHRGLRAQETRYGDTHQESRHAQQANDATGAPEPSQGDFFAKGRRAPESGLEAVP
jgi:hypothetical protein